MFDIGAFFCLFAVGTVIGASLSDRLRILRNYDRSLMTMMNQISVMIRYQALDVYEITTALRQLPACAELHFLKLLPAQYEPSQDFHQVWKEAVQSDKMLGNEETGLLLEFGCSFGMSDAEGQLSSLEAALASLSVIEKRRSEEYAKKGKLYRSVGMLFGVMAGIIVI